MKESKKSYFSEKDNKSRKTAPHIKGLYLLFTILTIIFVGRIIYLKAKPSEYDYKDSDKDFSVYISNLKDSNAVSIDSIKTIDSLKTDSTKVIKDSSKKKTINLTVDKKNININTASNEELIQLPGVGKKIAARIIEFRQIHGKFKTADDLIKVKGIGKKKLIKIKNLIIIK